MTDLEQRVAALEAHLWTAEDRFAIPQLIATYGPAVDGLEAGTMLDLWLEGGVCDILSHWFTGHAELAQLDTRLHCGYVDRGCEHAMSLPQSSSWEPCRRHRLLQRVHEGWRALADGAYELESLGICADCAGVEVRPPARSAAKLH